MGAEFVRGRVCQGPSLFGAEMSRNRLNIWVNTVLKNPDCMIVGFVNFYLIF